MNRIRPTTFETVEDDPLADLAQIEPVPVRQIPASDKVRKIADEAGFTARHGKAERDVEEQAQATFDARSLRKTGRSSQLNIAIKPGTKDRFWSFAIEQGFVAGEDALLALLDSAER
ncbi:hypothetical protein [Pseudophaeobacter sp. 1A09344]|uniref:hypothetical protein n=1 Tax=Pseudophaeobacter sp. 1A09344 TaxID=3098144 RepID=UPI0034D6C31C